MKPPGAESGFEHIDAEAAVLFVDMAGFTAFTDVHGDHLGAQLADRFLALATSVLGPGDELVKSIGDAVLVTSESALTAMAYVRRLNERAVRAPGLPMLRAGLSAGPVVRRRGDVFGRTVNVAARLAALAEGGQVLAELDSSIAPGESDTRAATSVRSIPLRNLREPVTAVAIDVDTEHQAHVDPMCRMHITLESSEAVSTQDGRLVRFCSAACARDFVASRDDELTPNG